MLKRLFDFFAAFFGLIVFSPLLLPVMLLVWWQDKHSPFYVAPRVGKGETSFDMVKLRSMVINADKSEVDSTSANDNRITPVGQFIRKYKLDELTQLWNVLIGEMSLVGPRPNVKRETDLYSDEEKKLLTVRPGITDIASIVFSDEGEILADEADPDLAYNQLIRPWKSRLGIIYIENKGFWLDVRLILLTAMAILDRERALLGVSKELLKVEADSSLVEISKRENQLTPSAPPGKADIVVNRVAGAK
jgi:lipopolysaccharide/colanic/teichoic acid biosynthesis glycosyltransferase